MRRNLFQLWSNVNEVWYCSGLYSSKIFIQGSLKSDKGLDRQPVSALTSASISSRSNLERPNSFEDVVCVVKHEGDFALRIFFKAEEYLTNSLAVG